MSQLTQEPIIDTLPMQSSIGTLPPSRPSTTLEHQMIINTDPSKPRGEPQLVGLTKYWYTPAQLQIQTTTTAPSSNFIIQSLQHFYPQKPQSKRVQQMRRQSKHLAATSSFVEVTIVLPVPCLIEQINLQVDQPKPKKQSEFSQLYQLVSVTTQNDELLLKSAYSECVTQAGRLEYNVVGVTQKLNLVFAVASSNVEVNQIELQMQQQADIDFEDRVLSGTIVLSGLVDSKDDLKFLDALPHGSNPVFSRLLKQIQILGFNTHQIPAITNVTYFMNQALFLQSKGKQQQALEADFLACQLLITTKRATQAGEMIRKLQIAELNGHNSKYHRFVKCAVYELLIADSISGSLQMNDKLHSIQRLFTFLQAEVPSDMTKRFYYESQVTQTDVFTQLLDILPECLRFTFACLSHKLEIVRVSSLKFLKFILEEVGCSLDYGLVFCLKAMFQTYPSTEPQLEDFNFKQLLGLDITIVEYLFKQKQIRAADSLVASKLQTIEEPQSGSRRAMVTIYNSVLDTVISVLSSVSSHILHAIFYDVVEQTVLNNNSYPVEVRVLNCKIADKILTICQGDLILSPQLLDAIMAATSLPKQPADQPDNSAQNQLKTLWLSIRQKVLPNYSTRGFKQIVGWLADRLSDTTQNDESVRQMSEIVSILSLGRQKSEEDANQLIKLPTFEQYGGGPSSELYLLLSPLLHWLEYSIDKEERFNMFITIYQSIKDILSGLPKGQTDLTIVTIVTPSIIRASKFIEHNSPTYHMLKFLDLVLSDYQTYFKTNPKREETQTLLCELLLNFVVYLPYSMFEESLQVFEKLLQLCQDSVSEQALNSCILALVDKYSQKTKQSQASLQMFMQFILSPQKESSKPSHFEVMADFCFFHNKLQSGQKHKQLEFRSAQDVHDIFNDKLQFFVDCIQQMTDQHISVFTNLITHPAFKQNLLSLLESGQSSTRLKSHEILESLTAYFVQFCPSKTIYEFSSGNQNDTMEAEFISHERLYIAQIVVSLVRASLQRDTDSYLQFNALILLDFLFQNLLPVPTFQNELIKAQRKAEEEEDNSGFNLDVEVLSISESTPEMDVMDPCYLRMRMKLVFSMWPYVQEALNSPWSNIRSICYGLICSMLRIDVNDFQAEEDEQSFDSVPTQTALQQIVLPMLQSLLSSRESESKAGGLNILGSFCGLSYDFSTMRVKKHLAFFQRNTKFVSLQIWKLVWALQDDWDITIKEASVVLIQLCAPRNCVLYLESIKKAREQSKIKFLKGMKPVSEVYAKQVKPASIFPSDEDCKNVLNQSSDEETTHVTFQQFMFSMESSFLPEAVQAPEIIQKSQSIQQQVHKFNPDYEDKRLLPGAQAPSSRRRQMEIELGIPQTQVIDETFFVDLYTDDQIQEIISIFRNDFKPPKSLWIEKQPQHQKQSGQQPAISQSPDFYQYIYTDAIEQFNQHQLMMQQKQQDELQQQVSGGVSNSSISSQESVVETMINSDTPSPPLLTHIEETFKDPPTQVVSSPPISSSTVSTPLTVPTSPVLVCQKKPSLQIEKINMENLKVQEPKQDSSQRQVVVENLQETIKVASHGSPKNKPHSPVAPVDPNRISRKTAQTYLSNLNNGYLQNFDNLRLINTCISQTMSPQYQQPASPNSVLNLQINTQPKKLSIKTVGSGGTDSINVGSTRNKKKTLTNSPENQQRKLSQKPGSRKIKPRTNISDLNYFIKSLEKGLSTTATPSNIIKKVEEQMRSLGVDPKFFKQIEQQEMSKEGTTKPLPPMMMHLALNKITKEDLTPNNFKKSSDVRSQDSESEFRKKRVRDSDSKDNQSTGRGGASYTLLQQPAIMTERNSKNQSLGFKSQGKQSNSTRYDSAGLFQFQKGLSKSHKKGYSTLVSKAIMSPKNEHQQSGGLIHGKLNLSASQLQKLKKPKTKLQASQEFEPKTSARQPQSTRQLEQGDRKQVTSPPMQPQVQKKKRQGHSQNTTNKPALFLSPPSYI